MKRYEVAKVQNFRFENCENINVELKVNRSPDLNTRPKTANVGSEEKKQDLLTKRANEK